jgi:ankyrin repeat protein
MTYGRHLSGMRLLLDAGADVNAMNTRGETAVDMAEGFGKGGKLEMEMLLEYGGKPGRYLDASAKPEDDLSVDDAAEDRTSDASSQKAETSEEKPPPVPDTPLDVDLDALRAKLTKKNEKGKIPPEAAAQVEAAASARLQFDEEDDIDDAQRAKRERAQALMRKFQEQAKELERLHAQAKASQPDEL